MYFGTIAIACCSSKYPDEFSQGCILAIVEAYAQIDEAEMRLTAFPPLYQSGIRYKSDVEAFRATVCGDASCGDDQKVDEWQDAETMLKKKTGNCKDLVAYRLAELRLRGDRACYPSSIRTVDPTTGRWMYHIILVRGDGEQEDPSAELGMTTPW